MLSIFAYGAPPPPPGPLDLGSPDSSEVLGLHRALADMRGQLEGALGELANATRHIRAQQVGEGGGWVNWFIVCGTESFGAG
jgi:hypothetical protein